jgi:hypothetical protein
VKALVLKRSRNNLIRPRKRPLKGRAGKNHD